MNCDCDTCCNACGHDSNCTSRQTEPEEPGDHYAL